MRTPGARVTLRRRAPAFAAVLLAAAACTQSSEDLLLFRDGGRKSGALQGCGGDLCALSGATTAIAAIEWIGLHGAKEPPPKVANFDVDETHLVDGMVHAGKLLGVTAERVTTERGAYDRAKVAWIHLASRSPRETGEDPGAEGPSGGPGGGASPGRPTRAARTGSPRPSVTPPPSPSPPPTRPPGRAVTPCPEGKPLGGWFQLDEDYGDRCVGTQTKRLRFRLVSSDGTGNLYSGFSGREVHWEVSASECSGVDHWGGQCHGPGGSKRGTLDMGRPNERYGFFVLNPHAGYLHFRPVVPELVFLLSEGSRADYPGFDFPIDCVGPGQDRSHGSRVARIFMHELSPMKPSNNLGKQVAGTACANPRDEAQRRDCMLHADRYAVLPFRGEATWERPASMRGLDILRQHVTWDVCCGCGEAGRAPPPVFTPPTPEPTPDCSELGRLIGAMRGLGDAYKFHERDYKCAVAGRDKARDQIWGGGGLLVDFSDSLLQLARALVTQGVLEAASKIQKLASLVGAGVDLSQLADPAAQVEAAITGISNPKVYEYATAARIKIAIDQVRAYWRANPGDVAGAKRVYYAAVGDLKAIGDVQKMMKGLAITAAFADFAFKGEALAEQIRLYFEWRQEAEDAKREMDKINDQMADLQRQIDAWRARCPNYPNPTPAPPIAAPQTCPDVPTGHAADLGPSFQLLPAALGALGGGPVFAASADPQPSAADVEKLKSIRTIYDDAERRFIEKVLPALAPFILQLTDGVDPRLLSALAEDALPDLEALQSDGERAEKTGREVESALKRGQGG